VPESVSTMKGSGSYADFIFRFASSALFGHDIPPNEALPWKRAGANANGVNRRVRARASQTSNNNAIADSSEVYLYRHSDGTFSCQPSAGTDDETVLRFATAYGFKNIQMMMQRVSTGDMKMNGYHYLEFMACPSGCLNGGGQIHAANSTTREKPSEIRERVGKTREFVDDIVPWLKSSEMDGSDTSTSQELLHTRFHVVPKLELSTGATAGVAVENTQW